MEIFNGYRNIKVKVLYIDTDLAKHCYEFGRFGESIHYDLPSSYDKSNMECIKLINNIIDGKTFPKYALTGHRIMFSIEGISRICLSQLTRDDAIFCSGTHGTMPVKQNYNMPMNIFGDGHISEKVITAYNLLYDAYRECLEKEIPYPEARYILPGNLTINVNCSFTPAAFVRACYSRTNNSFCDELNYVYRKMYYELKCAIGDLVVGDFLTYKLWKWLIREEICIDDNYYNRASIFNSDFNPDTDKKYDVPAQNDWRKSCWKMELERMLTDEPWLLTKKEQMIIRNWIDLEKYGQELPTTYDKDDKYVGKNYVSEVYNEK